MANISAAFGLWPERQISGQKWTGAANMYYVPSTYGSNIFLGDPVVPTGTSDANGVPGVQLATAGASNLFLGPMVGISNGGEPIIGIERSQPVYHPASTAQYILVADDPMLLYRMEENGNMGANASMNNANMVSGSGSTVTGLSGWMINSSSLATTNTLQLRIYWLWRASNNAIGTNAVWLVGNNQSSILNTTGV